MNVLMVEPGKAPYVTDIGNDLRSMQQAVGGYIQAVYPYEEAVVLVCNEEGKLDGLPLNRALRDEDGDIYDIVAGNFFLAGVCECGWSDHRLSSGGRTGAGWNVILTMIAARISSMCFPTKNVAATGLDYVIGGQ